jgi:glutamyl-tRNA synthetase
MNNIRTRFAPSPTGALHLGAVRTALFAWLFAKHNNGNFILRIEDTDQKREVTGATDTIKETLKWLGIEWDEGPDKDGQFGPYTQSERLGIYRKFTDELINSGKAYRCWCTPERLDQLRKTAQANKVAFKYDRYCLKHPSDSNLPHVVRILIPDGEPVVWKDLVKDTISVERHDLDDFVGLKSDGFPTYHLASVIDDHLMQISHVIRSVEWLASTPKHLILYELFGWEKPFFAHVPNVLSENGRTKLSKRHGAKAVLEYRDEGYLQSALINMMATLGWNDGTEQEIFSTNEIIDKFSLERVQKSPAVLDSKRLLWLQGAHIRNLSLDELFNLSHKFLPDTASEFDIEYQKNVLKIIQDRLKYFAELPMLSDYFFAEPNLDLQLIKNNKQLGKIPTNELANMLSVARNDLSVCDWDIDTIQDNLNLLLDKTSQKPAILFSLIRICLTWAPFSPGLAETLFVLGQERSIKRIDQAIVALS